MQRTIDSSGSQSFGQELSGGVARATIVQDVLNSSEARTLQVEGQYSQYLGRAADPNGLASSLAALQTGTSVEQLAALLIASPEYLSHL